LPRWLASVLAVRTSSVSMRNVSFVFMPYKLLQSARLVNLVFCWRPSKKGPPLAVNTLSFRLVSGKGFYFPLESGSHLQWLLKNIFGRDKACPSTSQYRSGAGPSSPKELPVFVKTTPGKRRASTLRPCQLCAFHKKRAINSFLERS